VLSAAAYVHAGVVAVRQFRVWVSILFVIVIAKLLVELYEVATQCHFPLRIHQHLTRCYRFKIRGENMQARCAPYCTTAASATRARPTTIDPSARRSGAGKSRRPRRHRQCKHFDKLMPSRVDEH